MTSEEVNDAEGAAPARVDVIELLNAKREARVAARKDYKVCKEMRDEEGLSNAGRLIESLDVIIKDLEIEAAVVIESTGRKEAENRLLGIKRAHGSTVASYQDDEARVQQAVAALGEAITTLNSRAKKLEALRAEAAALADRFELAVPLLTMVSEPQLNLNASLPRPWQLRPVRPSFEADEHHVRERRDYTEIAGTPGYAIITKAGLRPFRAFTEQEREVLEDREAWKPDPVTAAAGVEATALGKLGVPGGHVHRG